MAIIRLDCNLNGGDSVTPSNELFYRIYGDIDAYAAPIHETGTALSDANVTIDGDVVIITGVDGTTNTSFKIAGVDAAFNEGILSDAYDATVDKYAMSVQRVDEVFALLTDYPTLGAGDYLELKVRYTEATTSNLLGTASTANYLRRATATGEYQISPDGGDVYAKADTMVFDVWTTIGVRQPSSGNGLEVNVDNAGWELLAGTTISDINFYRVMAITETPGNPARYAGIDLAYVDWNGDLIEFTDNTSLVHKSNSDAITLTFDTTAATDILSRFILIA